MDHGDSVPAGRSAVQRWQRDASLLGKHITADTPAYIPADLPVRPGELPDTNDKLPHAQFTDTTPDAMFEAYRRAAMARYPDSVTGRSHVSMADSLALHLRDDVKLYRPMIGREWAHIHHNGGGTGSWHLILSPRDVKTLIEKRWGELHYMAGQHGLPMGLAMVYAPRDQAEVETVFKIVDASHSYVTKP